tara:strand:- start:80 stop:424 length:345 start_codon:yes stop_codon:yes gene_type:complete
MSQNDICKRTTISNDLYEPFMLGDKQAGEVHWLSQTNSTNEPTFSGLWRCEPMTFEYEFPGDEYIYVLSGELHIQTKDGDYDLKQGDIVMFNKGVKSTWTVKSSFKKFFVIDNC